MHDIECVQLKAKPAQRIYKPIQCVNEEYVSHRVFSDCGTAYCKADIIAAQ